MKKRLMAMLMAGVMTAAMAGCGSSSTTPAASSGSAASGTATTGNGGDGNYKISVILKTTSAEYWQFVQNGAEAYAAEHDGVSVEVKGATSETAYDEQQNMIETDLNSSAYDGIIIAPLQSDMAAQLVSGASMPIIALDTKFEANEVVSFVGTGNEAAAKLGAEAAVQAAKDAGWNDINCIEIAGVQGDETNTARMNGYKAGVEENGGDFLDDEIQYANAVADQAVTCMEAVMQNHPEGIAIICANNDDMAMAAARAAKGNSAYDNTIFLGFNGDRSACNAIMSNELTMSVAQMAYEMGYKAVETMVASLNGESVEPFVDSGSEVITADNAADRLSTLEEQLG